MELPQKLYVALNSNTLLLPRGLCLKMTQVASKIIPPVTTCAFEEGLDKWLTNIHPNLIEFVDVLRENGFEVPFGLSCDIFLQVLRHRLVCIVCTGVFQKYHGLVD